jgi:hypothetical protein
MRVPPRFFAAAYARAAVAGDGDTRDIVGFPVVPPPAATRAANWLRRRLSGAHRRTAPPGLRVLEALFGLFDNRVLGLLVELDIPEHLDRPRSVAELASATGVDADALFRVLRYAAGRGFVAADGNRRFRASDVTSVLRRDHPNSWRGWVEFATSDWFWNAWRHAPSAVRGDSSGAEAATGHPFFEYVTRVDPHAGRVFNDAMRAGAALQALALERALDWTAVRTVCDVGGGTGAVLERLLTTHAHLGGTLFDLPEVVGEARPSLHGGELAARCRLVGGSFFEAVPPDHDRYLLLAIVHDWGDEDAVAILGNVAAALRPGAEAVVVEGILPDAPRDDFVVASDLLMLVLASGRERTASDYDALFTAAGLSLVKRVPLATGFVAFRLARR